MEDAELKGLFGAEALTYEAFQQKLAAADASKLNLANLAGGQYVDVNRHNREVEAARKAAVTASKEYTDLAAERDDYKAKYDSVVAENARKESLAKIGEKVAPDFVEFIYDKVTKEMAADNKKSLETALDEVLKAAPQYKKATTPPIKFNSGHKLENSGGEGQSRTATQDLTNAILLAAGRTPKN